MRTFSRSFYYFLMHIQTIFLQLLRCDFKNYSSNHISKLFKAPNQSVAK